jgi:acetylglutamate kinase
MHMSHVYASPVVIKYGGSNLVTDSVMVSVGARRRSRLTKRRQDPLLASLVSFDAPVVLVHGGGPEIDRALEERGIVTGRIDGLRITDEATLDTTEAVLCGTINKRLVRECSVLGLRAVGISGQDGGLLVARKVQNRALGFVGEIVACNPHIVHTLLREGMLPIIAPLAISEDGMHALNVNADLAAAAIAVALQAHAFVMVTNVPRVLRDPNDPSSGIDRLSLAEARAFAKTPECTGGMKPKIEAAIAAAAPGAMASYICGPGSLAEALAGSATVVAG